MLIDSVIFIFGVITNYHAAQLNANAATLTLLIIDL